jgi:hypothetical protein
VKLTMPAIAESGANVPAEVEVNLPSAQVKAIHLFADKNPTPRLVSFMPMKALPYYATRVPPGGDLGHPGGGGDGGRQAPSGLGQHPRHRGWVRLRR